MNVYWNIVGSSETKVIIRGLLDASYVLEETEKQRNDNETNKKILPYFTGNFYTAKLLFFCFCAAGLLPL